MTGSKALSCSWPASAAMVTVTSLPITSKATWFTTSGITGLTLPGMIDEPACRAGRLISPKPARGPDESRRRSLQIFESLTATRLSTPESCTNAPQSWVASTRSGAVTSGMPVISRRWRADPRRVVGMRGDAGADRRRAHVDLADQPGRLGQPLLVLAEHQRVGAELLAEGHRHRVLQLGAADLQHVGELDGLLGEGAAQHGHRSRQPLDAAPGGELQRRRIDVVGRLAQVDVLVRVQARVVAARARRGARARGWR